MSRLEAQSITWCAPSACFPLRTNTYDHERQLQAQAAKASPARTLLVLNGLPRTIDHTLNSLISNVILPNEPCSVVVSLDHRWNLSNFTRHVLDPWLIHVDVGRPSCVLSNSAGCANVNTSKNCCCAHVEFLLALRGLRAAGSQLYDYVGILRTDAVTTFPICFKCAQGDISQAGFAPLWRNFVDALEAYVAGLRVVTASDGASLGEGFNPELRHDAVHVDSMRLPLSRGVALAAWLQAGGSVGAMRRMHGRELWSIWCPDRIKMCNNLHATHAMLSAARSLPDAMLADDAAVLHHVRRLSAQFPALRSFGNTWLRHGTASVVTAHATTLVEKWGMSWEAALQVPTPSHVTAWKPTWCLVTETNLRLSAWMLKLTFFDVVDNRDFFAPKISKIAAGTNLTTYGSDALSQLDGEDVDVHSIFLLREYLVRHRVPCACRRFAPGRIFTLHGHPKRKRTPNRTANMAAPNKVSNKVSNTAPNMRRLDSDIIRVSRSAGVATGVAALGSGMPRTPLSIVDVALFNGETDILRYRIMLHEAFASEIVVVESNVTFSGMARIPNAHSVIGEFKQSERYRSVNILILQPSLGSPGDGRTSWTREKMQRTFLLQALQVRFPRHYIFVSDVDEFLDAGALLKNQLLFDSDCFRPSLRFYYYGEHCQMQERWAFPVMFRSDSTFFSVAVKRGAELRGQTRKETGGESFVADHCPPTKEFAGWHFSYAMSTDAILKKLQAFSHANEKHIRAVFEGNATERLEYRISRCIDLYVRPKSALSFQEHAFDGRLPQLPGWPSHPLAGKAFLKRPPEGHPSRKSDRSSFSPVLAHLAPRRKQSQRLRNLWW